MFSWLNLLSRVFDLTERVGAGLAGADADDLLDRRDEDLAVADLAGAGGLSMASMTRSTTSSGTAASIFTLGRKSTMYSAPR